MFRTLLRIFYFCFTLTPALASAEVKTSPVQVVDHVKFADVISDFRSRKDLKVLSEFSRIVYDHYIDRPWGSGYFPEASNRWSALKAIFCPSLGRDICSIPDRISNTNELYRLTRAFDDPAVVSELKSNLRSQERPYFLDKVEFLEAPTETPAAPIFNLLVSAVENVKRLDDVRLWDMHAGSLIVKQKEFLTIQDFVSYYTGFTLDRSTSFISFNRQDEAILNLDLVHSMSQSFATSWKFKIRKVKEKPHLADPGKLSHYEEYLLKLAFDSRVDRFAAHYARLEARLKSMPKEIADGVLSRFRIERERGDYPEEVYQFVAAEAFLEILEKQASYFLLAKKHRPGLNLKRQIWESLLSVQAELDPHFVFYFINEESVFPSQTILGQFVQPSVARPYFFELLKAVLDDREYAGGHGYQRFGYVLKHRDLQDEKFLKEHAPEALAFLIDPTTGKKKDLFEMNESKQKEFWKLLLYRSDGGIRNPAFYRMITALMLRISKSDAQDLARYIHEKRRTEFGGQ